MRSQFTPSLAPWHRSKDVKSIVLQAEVTRLLADRRKPPLGTRLRELARCEHGYYASLRLGGVVLGTGTVAKLPEEGAYFGRETATLRRGLGVEIVVVVNDVDGWRDRIASSGPPILEPLRDRPWGQRDFRIADPDGYYLFGLNLQEAIDAPNFHTEHFPSSFYPRTAEPGKIVVEGRLQPGVVAGLRARGHDVTVVDPWSLGCLCAVSRDPESGLLRAAANPRGMQGYAVGR